MSRHLYVSPLRHRSFAAADHVCAYVCERDLSLLSCCASADARCMPSRLEDGVSAADAQLLAALGTRTVPMCLPSPEELDNLGFFLRHEDPPISPRE